MFKTLKEYPLASPPNKREQALEEFLIDSIVTSASCLTWPVKKDFW
jgi:hypothetical protein